MGTQENRSEVAQFLQRYDEEVEAMLLGLHGIAMTARHDFIAQRIQAFAIKNTEQLRTLMNQQEIQTNISNNLVSQNGSKTQ